MWTLIFSAVAVEDQAVEISNHKLIQFGDPNSRAMDEPVESIEIFLQF